MFIYDTHTRIASNIKIVQNVDNMNPSTQETKIIGAIKAFAGDLWTAFGDKSNKPLALYLRLLESDSMNTEDSKEKFIQGFTEFFTKYDKELTEGRLESIDQGSKITYNGNKNVSIEVQRFLSKSDQSCKESIRKHLLIISALIAPTDSKIAALAKNLDELGIDTSTKEGELMSSMMKDVREAVGDGEDKDPMTAMMSLMTSGKMPKLYDSMKDGSFDMMNLMGAMNGMLGTLPPAARAQMHAMAASMAEATKPTNGSTTRDDTEEKERNKSFTDVEWLNDTPQSFTEEEMD